MPWIGQAESASSVLRQTPFFFTFLDSAVGCLYNPKPGFANLTPKSWKTEAHISSKSDTTQLNLVQCEGS